MSTETNPDEPDAGDVRKTPLPKGYALRCASCGGRATTTILLEGFTTPVCLRHYNVWNTPMFREPDAGDVEALAEWLWNSTPKRYHWADATDYMRECFRDDARRLLASDWLAARDAEVRRTAAKETAERIEADALELVREWTQMDGRLHLRGRDLADFRDQLADVIAGRSS